MKLHLSFFAAVSVLHACTAAVAPVKRAAQVDQLVGYASLNGGTTGGTGGTTTTVTTLADLRSALEGDSAKIVKISGIIQGDGDVIDVGSHTTVIGVGSDSGITGGGLRLKNVENVIVRNLKISKSPAPTDLIGLQGATNVWIDHNELWDDLNHGKDYYDGATDITHASDYVTVSWNKYHDVYKTSLVGHSNKNSAQDTGHLRVTYHHNSFVNCGSRLPSLRFGTGHVYNSVMRDIVYSGVDSRLGAQMLIESNLFDNVPQAIQTSLRGGYAVSRNNIFTNSTYDAIDVGNLTSMPYTYTLDSASDVDSIVSASAGTGIVTG